MLLKFLKSRLVGSRSYAVGEVGEVADDVGGKLVKAKVAVVSTEEPKPANAEQPFDLDAIEVTERTTAEVKAPELNKPAEPAKPAKKK